MFAEAPEVGTRAPCRWIYDAFILERSTLRGDDTYYINLILCMSISAVYSYSMAYLSDLAVVWRRGIRVGRVIRRIGSP